MRLASSSYGKGKVRVMRAVRSSATHKVSEVTVSVMVEGDFASAYTQADNTTTIATDSIKNMVHAVAGDHAASPLEEFAMAVGNRLCTVYRQVTKAVVTMHEAGWTRLVRPEGPHPHAFLRDGNGRRMARAIMTHDDVRLSSGVEGFAFLKTAGSGFSGFVRDGFTTLPETADRLCGTSMDATWHWSRPPEDAPGTNGAILSTMLDSFVETFSHSLQDSLYRMGEAALAVSDDVSRVDLACPNLHFVPVDLTRFGCSDHHEIFIATDEPFGQIECSVSRDDVLPSCRDDCR